MFIDVNKYYLTWLDVVMWLAVASPKSGKKGKEGKGKKTEVEAPPEEQGPPPPEPGSDEWQFVERPIDFVRSISLFLTVVL